MRQRDNSVRSWTTYVGTQDATGAGCRVVLFAMLAGLDPQVRLGRRRPYRRATRYDPGTVARGRKQLLAQDIERERVRRPGGGRPPLEKKLPR